MVQSVSVTMRVVASPGTIFTLVLVTVVGLVLVTSLVTTYSVSVVEMTV